MVDENTRQALRELSEQLAHGKAPASEVCPKIKLAEMIKIEVANKARKCEAEFCNCSHCIETRRQKKLDRLGEKLSNKIIGRRPSNFIPELATSH